MPQHPAKFESPIGTRLNYLLHIPESYHEDEHKRWPLLLFLHGAGERGSNVHAVKAHGIPKVAERDPNFPFIAVSPQCPADSWWVPMVKDLDALCEEVISTYRVDPARQYLTGISMGGFGAWHLATAFPNRFAVVVPICGGFEHRGMEQQVCRIKHVPVWVFHGAQDDIVPIQKSEQAVEALKACGGTVQFTVYPHAKHDSWTETYDNPELYRWFLSQARQQA